MQYTLTGATIESVEFQVSGIGPKIRAVFFADHLIISDRDGQGPQSGLDVIMWRNQQPLGSVSVEDATEKPFIIPRGDDTPPQQAELEISGFSLTVVTAEDARALRLVEG